MDANDVTVTPTGSFWTSNQMIAVYVALGAIAAGVILWFLMRKTLRTRMGMVKTLQRDPDVSDWLVVFGWTSKVLYVPSIVAALIAALLVFVTRISPTLVGGVWIGIVFVNFLVEEYNINIKVLLISIAGVTAFLLWLHLLGWVVPFLRLFTHLAVSISPTGYILLAIIGLLCIGISWLHGLFYFAAITPNCLVLHKGAAEAGEQIGREDYNTRVDTGDFLERLLGFGRIIITFKDNSRPPIMLLVWHVDSKALMLQRVREKFALDYPQGMHPLPPVSPPPTDTEEPPSRTDPPDQPS